MRIPLILNLFSDFKHKRDGYKRLIFLMLWYSIGHLKHLYLTSAWYGAVQTYCTQKDIFFCLIFSRLSLSDNDVIKKFVAPAIIFLLIWRYCNIIIIIVASVFIILRGNINPIFTSYNPCIRFCLLNFPSKFSWKQKISMPSNFPAYLMLKVNLEDKSVHTSFPRIENNRHNCRQCLTTPSGTHFNNHFASFYSTILNISIVGEN